MLCTDVIRAHRSAEIPTAISPRFRARRVTAAGLTAQGKNQTTAHHSAIRTALAAIPDAEHRPPHCPENKRSDRRDNRFDKKNSSPVSPLLKFIPQSIYNPDTGKVLGFLSAEDLLIVALILLLIDNRDSDEDNSLLIYALVYILISDRINLPF